MKKLLADLAERTFWTYVEVITGLLIVGPSINVSTLHAAAIAAIPAGLTVVKGFAASRIGDKNSAALLPSDIDPPKETT